MSQKLTSFHSGLWWWKNRTSLRIKYMTGFRRFAPPPHTHHWWQVYYISLCSFVDIWLTPLLVNVVYERPHTWAVEDVIIHMKMEVPIAFPENIGRKTIPFYTGIFNTSFHKELRQSIRGPNMPPSTLKSTSTHGNICTSLLYGSTREIARKILWEPYPFTP